ncbi:MAG TPA: di-heme oxidoredictase family protein [Terriglobia bacterium]|jgi:CxxC motif-containing protein (DUF1111 family)
MLSNDGAVEGQSRFQGTSPDTGSSRGGFPRDRDYEEAPSGFDNLTNGFLTQEAFERAQEIFEELEEEDEGLGPVYNAQGCSECHQNPVAGGISQITELRAGRSDGHGFTEHPGGSLINDRAIHPAIQERVLYGYNVRTFRTSLNTLGDGFVESIADETFQEIANRQPGQMRGDVILVPVGEAGGALAVGRFGWKNQHASLLSFSADAYLNEMGITSPLQPNENSSNGQSLAAFDSMPDPEDLGDDVEEFAAFMRSTKAPPRDERLAATQEAQAGEGIFRAIGCSICHVPSIATAPPQTEVNGGMFVVPEALGNKIIHPFGDFLLHNIGTGDGIVQNGGPATRNKLRTAPLWGVRTRTRLMHDGQSLTFEDAILRHLGEAAPVTNEFRRLSHRQRSLLIRFLESL